MCSAIEFAHSSSAGAALHDFYFVVPPTTPAILHPSGKCSSSSRLPTVQHGRPHVVVASERVGVVKTITRVIRFSSKVY